MTKNEIKKKYGLNQELFNFYLKMNIIQKIREDEFKVKEKLEHLIIEKSTVYKYYFSDSFMDDIKEFANSVKYNSKVKIYTKEEIEEYLKKRNKKWDS